MEVSRQVHTHEAVISRYEAQSPPGLGLSTDRLTDIFLPKGPPPEEELSGRSAPADITNSSALSGLSWERTKRRAPAEAAPRGAPSDGADGRADDARSLASDRLASERLASIASSRAVQLRDVRASPEEAAAAYQEAETTLNFSNDRLASIAKLSSSVHSSGTGGPPSVDSARSSTRALNMDGRRLESIAKMSSARKPRGPAASRAPADIDRSSMHKPSPAQHEAAPASVMWSGGGGRARAEGQRRNTLTPAETVVGVRGVAADAVGQSVASLRTKLRSLTDEEARAGGATERGFDVSPHLDSLAQMSKVHVQQKRQEIAHAKTSLDKAMAEVRECQRAEAAEFDGRVAELKGEFNEQLAQLEREFMMHAERYASQLRAAVGQLHEQHERSLQRRTEVLLYSLTHPPPNGATPANTQQSSVRKDDDNGSLPSSITMPEELGSDRAGEDGESIVLDAAADARVAAWAMDGRAAASPGARSGFSGVNGGLDYEPPSDGGAAGGSVRSAQRQTRKAVDVSRGGSRLAQSRSRHGITVTMGSDSDSD